MHLSKEVNTAIAEGQSHARWTLAGIFTGFAIGFALIGIYDPLSVKAISLVLDAQEQGR